ncbi:hypothetical protein ACM55H_05270 [Flavobacterium sp. ZT3R17]|uniref:hypothetical protein n=1 Tax=Flavobacterium cryoconiti TaxID=3398736 RepID=UPI003A899648
MPGVRSSKLETEKRVFTIQGWIINGVPDYLILKNIEQQFVNKDGEYIKRRQSKVLLQKAYKIWHEEQEATVEQKRSLKIAELKQDVRSMDAKFKNTPQGMAVLLNYKKEINKLEAIYPVTKIMIQGDKENPLVITNSDEREARIAELIAKAQK